MSRKSFSKKLKTEKRPSKINAQPFFISLDIVFNYIGNCTAPPIRYTAAKATIA